jgi:transposase-like protein
MDQKARRFRKEASRTNGDRKGICRRYGAELRELAVSYCSDRRQAGASVNEVAQELGVSGWTLNRWIQGMEKGAEFAKVEVESPTDSILSSSARCVLVTPEGYRIEGLTVESAGQLVRVLR